jgi:hypothetical protein
MRPGGNAGPFAVLPADSTFVPPDITGLAALPVKIPGLAIN